MSDLLPNGLHTDESNPLCVAYHQDLKQHFLYLYAGVDATDGRAQEMARAATPVEVRMWRQKRTVALVRRLGEEGTLPESTVRAFEKQNQPGWLSFLRRLAGRG